MKKSFSKEEVCKIARLSALELSEIELKNFSEQFTVILDYFEFLKTLEIPEIELDSHEGEFYKDRDDKVLKSQVSPVEFSPYLEGPFFRVPRVIDQGK